MSRQQQQQEHTPSAQQAALATLPLPELQAQLQATLAGLRTEEAHQRLARFGPNEIVEKHVHPLFRLLASFWGPIPWMIEIAALLSLVVRHWADFIIIFALLVMNALVGFWEEYQADTTIAALKSRLALQARVKRDGRWHSLPARELVPGDLIHLRLGEIVPADARLLEGDPVEVDHGDDCAAGDS